MNTTARERARAGGIVANLVRHPLPSEPFNGDVCISLTWDDDTEPGAFDATIRIVEGEYPLGTYRPGLTASRAYAGGNRNALLADALAFITPDTDVYRALLAHLGELTLNHALWDWGQELDNL